MEASGKKNSANGGSKEAAMGRLAAAVGRLVMVGGKLAVACAAAVGAVGCEDTEQVGKPETTASTPCDQAELDGVRVAATDGIGGAPYKLGYAPYSAEGCSLVYVGEKVAGYEVGPLLIRDLVTGEEQMVADASEKPRRPSLSGGVVTWEAEFEGKQVVRVWANGKTVTVEGPFDHAGEPRATSDGVVFTAFLSDDDLGDTDIFMLTPETGAVEAVFVGPGQQRFPDISSTHIAFSDFAEDPDGRFDQDANDLADVVVVRRATGEATVRKKSGKQAFPLLGVDDSIVYLEWGPEHPEPKFSAYDLVIGGVEADGSLDKGVALIETEVPYVRPAAVGERLSWVKWPLSGTPSLWTQLADLSSPPSKVSGIEGPMLVGPSLTKDFVLAIVVVGDKATLQASTPLE